MAITWRARSAARAVLCAEVERTTRRYTVIPGGRKDNGHHDDRGAVLAGATGDDDLGRTDDAIRHLRLAIERHEPFRSLAAEDGDFDPIRGEPAFEELVRGDAAEPTAG